MGFMDKFKDVAQQAQQAAAGQSSVGGLGEKTAYRDRMMRLNQIGVETPATITSLQPTGRKDMGGAEYSITAEVQPQGSEPYTTTFTQAMVEQQLAHFTEGAAVTVKVDPEDRDSMILWGAA